MCNNIKSNLFSKKLILSQFGSSLSQTSVLAQNFLPIIGYNYLNFCAHPDPEPNEYQC